MKVNLGRMNQPPFRHLAIKLFFVAPAGVLIVPSHLVVAPMAVNAAPMVVIVAAVTITVIVVVVAIRVLVPVIVIDVLDRAGAYGGTRRQWTR